MHVELLLPFSLQVECSGLPPAVNIHKDESRVYEMGVTEHTRDKSEMHGKLRSETPRGENLW
jgi:hypothetical protein